MTHEQVSQEIEIARRHAQSGGGSNGAEYAVGQNNAPVTIRSGTSIGESDVEVRTLTDSSGKKIEVGGKRVKIMSGTS